MTDTKVTVRRGILSPRGLPLFTRLSRRPKQKLYVPQNETFALCRWLSEVKIPKSWRGLKLGAAYSVPSGTRLVNEKGGDARQGRSAARLEAPER